MATREFDYDRWPAGLRRLAAAYDDAMRAFLDQMDDKQLLSEFEAAGERFREAHQGWLREHPNRIPGLIAHRLRQQRRPRTYSSYGDYESGERIREAERAGIDGLWLLHREALNEQATTEVDEPVGSREPTGPPKFTIEVTAVRNGYQATAFGVFEAADEADDLAAQWRADARADGLTDLFVSVREIRHVSAYTEWVAPHQRRVQQEHAAMDLAAQRTRLLLEFHDDEAIRELAPQLVADALTETGRFEVTSPAEAIGSYRRAAQAAGRLLAKPVTTTEAQSPDGSVLTVVLKTTIDLAPYRAEHGRPPRGPGSWTLRNAETGEELTRTGTWGEVRASIPAGAWKLLP
jgi:hypothetical protein